MLIQAYGSRDDSWLPVVQGTFLQFGTIQVLGKENIQPDFLEVRLAEVKKNQKKNREKQQFLIKAVYEMIDKRAISPVTSLEFYSYSLFLGVSEEEMTVSILKVR